MARPRLNVDETAIVNDYLNGATILGISRVHGVDRDVIRRVLDDHQIPRQEHRGAHWAKKRAAREATP